MENKKNGRVVKVIALLVVAAIQIGSTCNPPAVTGTTPNGASFDIHGHPVLVVSIGTTVVFFEKDQ